METNNQNEAQTQDEQQAATPPRPTDEAWRRKMFYESKIEPAIAQAIAPAAMAGMSVIVATEYANNGSNSHLALMAAPSPNMGTRMQIIMGLLDNSIDFDPETDWDSDRIILKVKEVSAEDAAPTVDEMPLFNPFGTIPQAVLDSIEKDEPVTEELRDLIRTLGIGEDGLPPVGVIMSEWAKQCQCARCRAKRGEAPTEDDELNSLMEALGGLQSMGGIGFAVIRGGGQA